MFITAFYRLNFVAEHAFKEKHYIIGKMQNAREEKVTAIGIHMRNEHAIVGQKLDVDLQLKTL